MNILTSKCHQIRSPYTVCYSDHGGEGVLGYAPRKGARQTRRWHWDAQRYAISPKHRGIAQSRFRHQTPPRADPGPRLRPHFPRTPQLHSRHRLHPLRLLDSRARGEMGIRASAAREG